MNIKKAETMAEHRDADYSDTEYSDAEHREDETDSETEREEDSEALSEIWDSMVNYFIDPEGNEFELSTSPQTLLKIFQEIIKKKQEVYDTIIITNFFASIRFIECGVGFDISTQESRDALLEICNYFETIETLYINETDIGLSDMLPFLKSLFETHETIKSFVFQNNTIYKLEEPTETDISNVTSIFELISSSKITYLNLSDSIKPYSEEILDYAIVKPLIDCLKKSNISTLDLGFCNLKNEDIFLHLLSNLSKYVKEIHFEYNIEKIKDINTFIMNLFNTLSTTNIFECNLEHIDDEYEGPEITDKTLSYVREIMEEDNFSLIDFRMSCPPVNKIMEPFLDRNKQIYWLPKHNSYFCNDDNFYKMLITFLLLNYNHNNSSTLPQLPQIICNQIFGMFRRNTFINY